MKNNFAVWEKSCLWFVYEWWNVSMSKICRATFFLLGFCMKIFYYILLQHWPDVIVAMFSGGFGKINKICALNLITIFVWALEGWNSVCMSSSDVDVMPVLKCAITLRKILQSCAMSENVFCNLIFSIPHELRGVWEYFVRNYLIGELLSGMLRHWMDFFNKSVYVLAAR